MEKKRGIVKEVFLENDDINSKKIGFKIIVDKKVKTIIQEQNEINPNILKNDEIIFNRNVVDGKEIVDIELYDGEEDE